MSIRIMSRVWDSYPGGGTELLALLALADWSDDNGRCYPSMAAIAKKIRLSSSQSRRVVHSLIDAGFVSVIGNENGGAPGASRKYQISIEQLTASTDARGSVDARGSTHARDGLHGCAETASTDASQTVIEPSLTVSGSLPSGKERAQPKKADRILECPHQEIIALYAKHLPGLPQVRIWEGQRANTLKARWRWVLTANKPKGGRYAIDRESALDFFNRFFEYVAKSDFLTGKSGKFQGCDLGWLVKADNFVKVIEGKYDNRESA